MDASVESDGPGVNKLDRKEQIKTLTKRAGDNSSAVLWPPSLEAVHFGAFLAADRSWALPMEIRTNEC